MNRRKFIQTTAIATTAFTAVRLAAHAEPGRDVGSAASQEPQDLSKPAEASNTVAEFKPGDTVPVSAVYDTIHDRLDGEIHAHPHQVAAKAGKTFPSCRACGEGVKFRLHQGAEPVESHDFFKV